MSAVIIRVRLVSTQADDISVRRWLSWIQRESVVSNKEGLDQQVIIVFTPAVTPYVLVFKYLVITSVNAGQRLFFLNN